MKKWLNIKPKVYDFSEDEVDTETESEDDGMCHSIFSLRAKATVDIKTVHFFILFSWISPFFFTISFQFALSRMKERIIKRIVLVGHKGTYLHVQLEFLVLPTSMSVF